MLTTAGRTFRPPFDPTAAYVAARNLSWGTPDGEVTILSGEPFDRAQLGCDDGLARRLYRVRHIAMVLDGDKAVVPVPQASPAADPPSAPPATSPSGLVAKSFGFGRFAVIDENGKRVHPPEGRWLTKEQAEAFASA